MRKYRGYVVIGLVALVVAIIALALSLQYTIDKSRYRWVCSQVVCEEYMSQQEWINRYCSLNESNEFNCNVLINGQQAVVPLKWLNVSSIQECKKYRCIQEMVVRNANYTISIPTS